MEDSVCIGQWTEDVLPGEIIHIINSCTPRQRRKLKRQHIIFPELLQKFLMMGCLPVGFPVDQGIRVEKLIEKLTSSQSKYRNLKNLRKAEWLYGILSRGDYESLARRVKEVGGPQQPKSSSLILERAGNYKNEKKKKSKKILKNEIVEKTSKQKAIARRRNGKVKYMEVEK